MIAFTLNVIVSIIRGCLIHALRKEFVPSSTQYRPLKMNFPGVI